MKFSFQEKVCHKDSFSDNICNFKTYIFICWQIRYKSNLVSSTLVSKVEQIFICPQQFNIPLIYLNPSRPFRIEFEGILINSQYCDIKLLANQNLISTVYLTVLDSDQGLCHCLCECHHVLQGKRVYRFTKLIFHLFSGEGSD